VGVEVRRECGSEINQVLTPTHFARKCHSTNYSLFSFKKVLVWINHHFLLAEEYAPNAASLYVTFLAVRTDTKLIIKMQNNGQVS